MAKVVTTINVEKDVLAQARLLGANVSLLSEVALQEFIDQNKALLEKIRKHKGVPKIMRNGGSVDTTKEIKERNVSYTNVDTRDEPGARSSVVERRLCKPKVPGSSPGGSTLCST